MTVKPHPTGFTLIEILVVIIILGVTLSFALLAVGDFGKSRAIGAAGEEFIKLVELAETQAILEPAVLGIRMDGNGYQFYRFLIEPQHPEGKWQPFQAYVFRPHQFPSGTSYTLTINKSLEWVTKPGGAQPQIVITSAGEITPFTLELMPVNAPAMIKIIAVEDGTITLQQ